MTELASHPATENSTKNLALFTLIGAGCALLNFLTRSALAPFLVFEVAIAVAYLLAMTVAFFLNRKLVFRSEHGKCISQYVKFAIVNALAFAQVFVVSVGLARIIFPAIGFGWRPEAVAHAIGLASPILTSYWGHKNFSFAAKRA